MTLLTSPYTSCQPEVPVSQAVSSLAPVAALTSNSSTIRQQISVPEAVKVRPTGLILTTVLLTALLVVVTVILEYLDTLLYSFEKFALFLKNCVLLIYANVLSTNIIYHFLKF